MTAIKTSKLHATQLLHRVLSTPNLVATVQALPAEKLGALVHDVGLEDAGELVALATTQQLESLFDEDLWRSSEEAEEHFDPERFSLWLEVLFEAGEGAVVQRLLDLPREFVCFAVARLAYVLDMDVLQSEVETDDRYLERVERVLESAASEEWGEYRLVDRGVGAFDVLVSALLALDSEHSTILREILERCCDLTTTFVEEHGGLIRTLSRLEEAEENLRGSRQERRTQRGYVSLADARSFLKVVVSGLGYDAGRDPVTHAHFREVYGKERASRDLQVANNPPRPPKKIIEALGSEVAATRGSTDTDRLAEALDVLREIDPAAFEHRVAELAYLANVLVAVSQPEARRVRPIEASEAVMRVCARGVRAMGFGGQEPRQLAVTLRTLLLDMAFRAGWPLLFADQHAVAEEAPQQCSLDPVIVLLQQLAAIARR